jgi:hypothetical protein
MADDISEGQLVYVETAAGESMGSLCAPESLVTPSRSKVQRSLAPTSAMLPGSAVPTLKPSSP